MTWRTPHVISGLVGFGCMAAAIIAASPEYSSTLWRVGTGLGCLSWGIWLGARLQNGGPL